MAEAGCVHIPCSPNGKKDSSLAFAAGSSDAPDRRGRSGGDSTSEDTCRVVLHNRSQRLRRRNEKQAEIDRLQSDVHRLKGLLHRGSGKGGSRECQGATDEQAGVTSSRSQGSLFDH